MRVPLEVEPAYPMTGMRVPLGCNADTLSDSLKREPRLPRPQ